MLTWGTVPFTVFGAGLRLLRFTAEDRDFTKGIVRKRLLLGQFKRITLGITPCRLAKALTLFFEEIG